MTVGAPPPQGFGFKQVWNRYKWPQLAGWPRYRAKPSHVAWNRAPAALTLILAGLHRIECLNT